jgi:hypothetical protein
LKMWDGAAGQGQGRTGQQEVLMRVSKSAIKMKTQRIHTPTYLTTLLLSLFLNYHTSRHDANQRSIGPPLNN